MKMKYTKALALFLTILASFSTTAQTFTGLQQSNFGGIHQANLNPANIANSRHRIYINGLTAGFGFNNDYLKLSLPFNYLNLITGNVPSQYKNSQGQLAIDDSWLIENVNGKSKNASMYLQTRAPGFMYKISEGFTVGLQYKNTISFQLNDIAEPLARLARYGIDSSSGSVTFSGPNQFQIGTTFGDNAFTVNLNAFGEIGLTLAKTIVKNDNLVLKVGATPKFLLGYGTGYIKNRGLLIKTPGTDTIVFGQTDVEYGYTDIEKFTKLNAINFDILNSTLSGKGFGYDLGFAFEFNPDGAKRITNKKNAYLFRGGISLLDAGHITYNKDLKNTRIVNNTGDKQLIINSNFSNAWSQGEARGLEFTDSVMRTLFSIDTSATNIISHMPTTLNLQFDYNVFKFIYVGANWTQDMRGKKSVGMRRASYLMLIPRIETKLFEISLPIGLMNDYRTGRIGCYLRVGPVFIGSDNLIGQIKSNNIYGADLYFGISTGIPSKKDKDKSSGNTDNSSEGTSTY
ncbi:MAG: hypothetical protein IT245_01340 [Bacteroidia bacterium]|nr:hypothetical protein [Bacteroidia bacterium]